MDKEESRFWELYRQAKHCLHTDSVYALLKNALSLFGYHGFEAELYRLVEGLKK
jgi:hypothetical protein